MLLPQSCLDDLPPEPRRRRRGGIVWQPHYAGFTSVAYRDGRAIAGISGPWSSQYVLIWWQPAQPVSRVEVFDTLDAAKAAVALGGVPAASGRLEELLAACREPIVLPQPRWLARLRRWRARFFARSGAPRVSRRGSEDTDLRGLNFRAVR